MKNTIRTITAIGMLSAVGLAFGAPLHAQAEESTVRVMSYNVYRGGTKRGQPLSQTVKVIQEAKADVVGLQEIGANAETLAQLLGWNHYGPILTRYEIVEEKRNGIKVKLPSGKEAYIFNLHLPSNPYQPYQLMRIQPKWHKHKDTPFIRTEVEAIDGAKKAHNRDIARLLRLVRFLPEKATPVFVVGDFNEPSHLDWSEKAAQSGRHPIKVEYPSSLEFAKAGFADAWRTAYPDEMEKPGFTWSPLTKPDNPKDHHDRIDFVYFKGKGVKVTDAKIVGENEENADIVVSPYPSDHRAVVATFTLSNQPKSEKLDAGDGKSSGVKPSKPNSANALETDAGTDSHGISAKLAAFEKGSDQVLYQKNHLYVFNGTTSVGLNPDHFGVHRLVAPPYIANPFSAELQLFGQKVSVDKYNWYPSEALFLGQTIKGISPSLQVVPLKSQRGALMTLSLRNTTAAPVAVPMKWGINGGPGKTANWHFGVSRSGGPFTTTIEESVLTKQCGDLRLVASVSGMDAKADDNSLSNTITIAPGKEVTHSLVIVFGDKKKVRVIDATACGADPDRLVQETRSYWTKLIDSVGSRLPELQGGTPELQAFYQAGLISYLSTRHEVPEFLFNPFYATSGVDGGAANCYLWDTSYTAFTGAILAPGNTRNLITQFLKLDINKCYAFDPIHGRPQGPHYAYNYYNLARLVYTYLVVTGDIALMEEEINGKSALTRIYEACLGREDLNKAPTLIDYGGNHNLLELKRTKNYTHVTPSPNGERILTYRYLTDIYQAVGKKTPHDLIQRGEALKKLYVEKLWNGEKQWLNTLDAKGNPRISYSIQIFDVLRTGMLSKQQEKGILSHLNEKEFLSEWGVHSLAKTDPGYDPRDVDWGGPGAYSGDPTELVVDLCQAGYPEQGMDVLNRILWWGELPYLPQAMRAGTKGYREDGRANLVSGGSTCHVVINGLFGVGFDLSQVTVKPINHPMMEGLSLKGVKIRDRSFDIAVSGGTFTVTSNGEAITKSLDESVILPFVASRHGRTSEATKPAASRASASGVSESRF